MEFHYARIPLEKVLKICEEYSDDVLVGFAGGPAKFRREARRSDVSHLEYARSRRIWKLHLADNENRWGSPLAFERDYVLRREPKDANWIKGTAFLQLVGQPQ